MYIVFTAENIPYCKTWDEVDADIIACQIGGYYVANKNHIKITRLKSKKRGEEQ